jgi:beta-ketodecanoyl-[acyl-carrier-protein] synthase
MTDIVISGTGVYHPPYAISNEELVESLNKYVKRYNEQHAAEIAAGTLDAKKESDADFIFKASGIKNRYVNEKSGILDINRMIPIIPDRPDDQLSFQAEQSLYAARDCLKAANKNAEDIDVVIFSSSYIQRPYPALAIEIQSALGIKGYAYDMSAACSSATFGIQAAVNAIHGGSAKCVLVINCEAATAQMDFTDRDCHFIFGEATTAVIVETAETCTAKDSFKIVSLKLKTECSNNIRTNFGYLNRACPETANSKDKRFAQEGRKVFKEIIPLVTDFITEHLAENHIALDQVKRFWLHQANANINRVLSERFLGKDYDPKRVPIIIEEFANTASAGSIIAFHKYHQGFKKGDIGVLCSFGAGYSVGDIILEKV